MSRRRRFEVHPGSLTDRIRTACLRGAKRDAIQTAALALPEDVDRELERLRGLHVIRTIGKGRSMVYFWQP